MNDVSNLAQDANIANILQRLKNVKLPSEQNDDSEQIVNDAESEVNDTTQQIANNDDTSTLMQDATTANILQKLKEADTNSNSNNYVSDIQDSVDTVVDIDDAKQSYTHVHVPWFNDSDLDTELIHYADFNDSGDLIYKVLKTKDHDYDLAKLRMQDNFAFDFDYYISKHNVLYVKQTDSNYLRTFVKPSCEGITIEEPKLELDVDAIDNTNNEVLDSIRCTHYTVYTDLGVADFIVKTEDVQYPYTEDLNKWFANVSNHVSMIYANYTPNNIASVDDSIRDFKYDIITLHSADVIALDSIDNADSNYKLYLTLKDKFKFIPLNRIIFSLKQYVKNPSITQFKQFVSNYFNINH
jgi:hypothetical protein